MRPPSSKIDNSFLLSLPNNMADEQTYIMIKPDGVQRGLIGNIVARFEVRCIWNVCGVRSRGRALLFMKILFQILDVFFLSLLGEGV